MLKGENMKKIAMVAVIATAAATAAPFNGFSIGGDLGAGFTKFKTKYTQDAKNQGKQDKSKSKTTFLMNMFVGYTKTFNNMFAGADFGFGYENAGKVLQDSNKKVSSSSAFLNPRVGYKFNEETGAYFKLGMAFNSYNFKKGESFKKGTFSWTPTAGVEKAFGNVSVRGELGYRFEKLKSNNKAVLKDMDKNAVVMTIGASYNF